jgi:dTDP-4-dehydrorhamnose reductase
MDKMKKVLITGGNGQLGLSIRKLSAEYSGLQLICIDIGDLDITDEKALSKFILEMRPDVIVNCAAYTAVDKAEEETEKALLINAEAVYNIARISKDQGIFMIHISTDYIFDGTAHKPYTESDPANPVSSYGNSKLQGELKMIESGCAGMIIRTSWLYSEYGNNFLKTIRRLAAERSELRIVEDQTGTPTYAGDLAKVIMEIISNLKPSAGVEIFNYSNEGIVSWFGFARTIVELGGYPCKVTPIPTSAYPLPARRPMFSVLSKEKIRKAFRIEIPQWEESLKVCLANMKPDK